MLCIEFYKLVRLEFVVNLDIVSKVGNFFLVFVVVSGGLVYVMYGMWWKWILFKFRSLKEKYKIIKLD